MKFVRNHWLAGVLPLLAVGCVSSQSHSGQMTWEEKLLFHPAPFLQADAKSTDQEFENAQFESADGTKLHGWYLGKENPSAVVLYCHGNAGNIVGRRGILRLYQEVFGASILLFDYRGYGKSEGTPSESGIIADARAARTWLARRAGVQEKDIVLVGNSLGGAVAVNLAAQDGARGLVLENTFTSIQDVAASHLSFIPVSWFMRTQFDSRAIIQNFKGPLLQTHGTADQVVPFKLGKELFTLANEPKKFVPIEGGDHNDLPTHEYIAALKSFLESLP